MSAVASQHPQHAEQRLRMGPSLEVLNPLAEDPSADAETSVPASRATRKLPAETLGDFRILRELGRGGMGVVFEAEQMSVGRNVALKVLPFATMFDDQALRRFRNEVRAAAGLEHPHITPIFTVGEDRGVHFYAMQLIRGQSLAQLLTQLRSAPQLRYESAAATRDALASPQQETRAGLSQSSVPARRPADHYQWIAQLMMQAAEALHYAHDQAIVHRDIKPANLLLDGSGKLWVTDFGLARTAQSDGITMAGERLIVAVNYSDHPSQCHVRLPFSDLGDEPWRLEDQFDGATYDWSGADLRATGLFLDEPAWKARVFWLSKPGS